MVRSSPWRTGGSARTRASLQAFRRLKEEGLIRHICVSSHLIGDQIVELLQEEIFEGVLFGYSAYNFPAREKAFQAIAARGLGCVVMNPLGGGLIPQNPDVFGFLRPAPDQDIVEAALHFLFAHEHITTALVGFATQEEVRQAAARGGELSQSPAPARDPAHQELVCRSAFQDLCTGCQYCDHCPEGIPVPEAHGRLQPLEAARQARSRRRSG